MAQQHSIAEARKNLPTLVRDAESGKTVELTRRGEPVAVLIGREQYDRLTSEYGDFDETYQRFTREFDLRELALDPDELFATARDDSGGRKVRL